MRAFFKRYRSSLLVITTLLAFVVLCAYGAYYLSNMIRNKSVALKQNKLDYALTQKDAQDIDALRDSKNYIDAHRDILHILLPNTDDDKVRLFATIEQLAQDSGNQEVRLTVKDTAKPAQQRTGASQAEAQEGTTVATSKAQDKSVITPSSPQHMFVTVAVTGSYPQVLTFMSRLENMPYLADVVWVRFTKQTAQDLPKEPLPEDAPPPQIDTISAEMDVAFYLAQ